MNKAKLENIILEAYEEVLKERYGKDVILKNIEGSKGFFRKKLAANLQISAMKTIANDFIEEATVLAELLESQPDSVFETVTLYKSWTVNDVLGHLHMFDVAALKTVEGEAVFENGIKKDKN